MCEDMSRTAVKSHAKKSRKKVTHTESQMTMVQCHGVAARRALTLCRRCRVCPVCTPLFHARCQSLENGRFVHLLINN